MSIKIFKDLILVLVVVVSFPVTANLVSPSQVLATTCGAGICPTFKPYCAPGNLCCQEANDRLFASGGETICCSQNNFFTAVVGDSSSSGCFVETVSNIEACNGEACVKGNCVGTPGGEICNSPAQKVNSSSIIAATPTPNGGGGVGGGGGAIQTFGALNFSPLGLKYKDMGGLITTIIKVLIGFVGIGFLVFFLMGALKYVTSSGDKKAVMSAQGTITSALIGLVLAAALFAIMSLLESVLGVKFLNVSI